MLLSKQQKYIEEVLKQLKYIRVDQLHALTREAFLPAMDIDEHRMAVMLRQMRTITNFVRFQDDIVCYGERETDTRRLEAIDVMLELTENKPSFYSVYALQEPLLLRFTGGGENDTRLFSVAWMDIPARIATTTRMKGERLIWIADGIDAERIGPIPKHQFFAQRQPDGTHRFFGSSEP